MTMASAVSCNKWRTHSCAGGVLPVLALLCGTAFAQTVWIVQYYPPKDAAVTIEDLAFPTSLHGVAVGMKSGDQPLELLTDDGGKTWKEVTLPQAPRSVYFLDEDRGWLVTESGIWRTVNGGADWTRITVLAGLRRVFFLNAGHGWAVGSPRAVYETTDGGKEWNKVAAADEVESNPIHTTYQWIDFATTRVGVITGASTPPRKGGYSPIPAWRDPGPAERRPEWPSLSIVLETRDGGRNWKASTTSIFGQITHLKYARDGRGLALVEFHDAFDWPSEVFRIDLRSGKSTRVFRQKDRAVTDMALFPGGKAYLAAIEASDPPKAAGKLRILRAADLENWEEMAVEIVIGSRAILATLDTEHAWVATDSGYILRLKQ
jgi:hypothetical protein